jgi:hypothetical protein
VESKCGESQLDRRDKPGDDGEKGRYGEAMIDLEAEAKALSPDEGCRLYAQRLQLWRLCGHAACRRARTCRDAVSCCRRFAAWAEEVKDAGQRDRDARDPEIEALRSELGRRLIRLAETLRDEK